MDAKKPWVSTTVTCKLKSKPKNYVGTISETFDVARDKPIPLAAMIVGFAIKLSEFQYAATDVSVDQLKEQLQTAAAGILNLEVHQCKKEAEK